MKRWLAAILVILMLMTMLLSCGKKSSDEESEDSPKIKYTTDMDWKIGQYTEKKNNGVSVSFREKDIFSDEKAKLVDLLNTLKWKTGNVENIDSEFFFSYDKNCRIDYYDGKLFNIQTGKICDFSQFNRATAKEHRTFLNTLFKKYYPDADFESDSDGVTTEIQVNPNLPAGDPNDIFPITQALDWKIKYQDGDFMDLINSDESQLVTILNGLEWRNAAYEDAWKNNAHMIYADQSNMYFYCDLNSGILYCYYMSSNYDNTVCADLSETERNFVFSLFSSYIFNMPFGTTNYVWYIGRDKIDRHGNTIGAHAFCLYDDDFIIIERMSMLEWYWPEFDVWKKINEFETEANYDVYFSIENLNHISRDTILYDSDEHMLYNRVNGKVANLSLEFEQLILELSEKRFPTMILSDENEWYIGAWESGILDSRLVDQSDIDYLIDILNSHEWADARVDNNTFFNNKIGFSTCYKIDGRYIYWDFSHDEDSRMICDALYEKAIILTEEENIAVSILLNALWEEYDSYIYTVDMGWEACRYVEKVNSYGSISYNSEIITEDEATELVDILNRLEWTEIGDFNYSASEYFITNTNSVRIDYYNGVLIDVENSLICDFSQFDDYTANQYKSFLDDLFEKYYSSNYF